MRYTLAAMTADAAEGAVISSWRRRRQQEGSRLEVIVVQPTSADHNCYNFEMRLLATATQHVQLVVASCGVCSVRQCMKLEVLLLFFSLTFVPPAITVPLVNYTTVKSAKGWRALLHMLSNGQGALGGQG